MKKLVPSDLGEFFYTIMDNLGWVKIHRKMLDWEWYDEYKTFRLFMHLILKANHKPKKYRGVIIDTGQIMTGISLLSEQTGLSFQKVRTALSNLKSTNEITIKTSNKGTIIQIVNYKDYQITTNEITNKQQTNNKQITTNKNVKNEKNINIPTLKEFLLYAKENDSDFSLKKQNITLKYKAWVENGWKTGVNKPIKSWKSTLLNTLSHIPKEYKQKQQRL